MAGVIIFISAAILCTVLYRASKTDKIAQENIEESSPQQEKDISEPVISFVETVLNDPDRFEEKELGSVYTGVAERLIVYCLKDTLLDLSYLYCYTVRLEGRDTFSIIKDARADNVFIDHIFNGVSPEDLPDNIEDLSFLTEDEIDYLDNKLFSLQLENKHRSERLRELLETRKNRNINRTQRNRLKKLYCKEK